MEEDDRSSASSESERENEPDEVMEDVDEADNDVEQDEDNNEEDEEDEGNEENDNDNDNDQEAEGDADADAEVPTERRLSAGETGDGDRSAPKEGEEEATRQNPPTPLPTSPSWLRPTVRPEAITARLYDIVPTMAAPQSTSINAMAITPDLRYWFTGGSDGYIRKYDGPGTINGKLTLTVAQKHPFVDSVTKAGILMSYWENEEPLPPGRGDQEHVLSPVYSLAVHSKALWLLSGLESGGINLQSVRHDEGKKITCLQKHTNAVSVLTLAQDEKSVLSGAWDKNIFDWDLNVGQVTRSFDGSGGQISAVELRPASGDPVPAEADEPLPSTTMSTNNGLPPAGGSFTNGNIEDKASTPDKQQVPPVVNDQASPAHESLFGGGSDAGSLFGEGDGDFGDATGDYRETGGDHTFVHDDDEYHAPMDMMPGNEGGMDHSADMAMTSLEMGKDEKDVASSAHPLADKSGGAMDIDAPLSTDTAALQGPSSPKEGMNKSVTNDPSLHSVTQPSDQASHENGQQLHASNEVQNASLDNQTPSEPNQPVQSPMQFTSQAPKPQYDPTQMSTSTFLSAAMDGTIRIWDRRAPNPVARIGNRLGVPPWCMSACWSPDGNMIYAGRRNGTVEEFDVRNAKRNWSPERVLKFPAGSGAVSAVKAMVNGRHLVCASHDILRLYDLQDTRAFKHSTVPFLIIPGPPRAGVISSLYVDPTSRFMLSAAGNRGWEGTNTEVLIGYEINVLNG